MHSAPIGSLICLSHLLNPLFLINWCQLTIKSLQTVGVNVLTIYLKFLEAVFAAEIATYCFLCGENYISHPLCALMAQQSGGWQAVRSSFLSPAVYWVTVSYCDL